jgi:hypothetical protein
MNTLPNELLLKIFGQVPWEYQIKNPLNVICKKWNNLIDTHVIDFGVCNVTLSINYGYTNFNIINEPNGKTVVFMNYTHKYNKHLENLLLKIPAYNLSIHDDFPYNSKLIKFHNKHVKVLELVNYLGHYIYKLNGFKVLQFNHTKSLLQIGNLWNPKEIYFSSSIPPCLFELLRNSKMLTKIQFVYCNIYLFKEKLSFMKSILSEKYKQTHEKVTIIFRWCLLSNDKFDLRKTHKTWFTEKLLVTLENGTWKMNQIYPYF